MTPGQYLGRFWRVNLIEHPRSYGVEEARARAMEILNWIDDNAAGDVRVVLLGARVGDAFSCGLWSTSRTWTLRSDRPRRAINLACVPHPSGRNLVYNDRHARVAAMLALRYAAGVL